MQEGSAAAGGHVQRRAVLDPLVVMHVSRKQKMRLGLQIQIQRLDHGRARRAGLRRTQTADRAAGPADSRRGNARARLRSSEPGAQSRLPNCRSTADKCKRACERQREVARALHRLIAGQRQRLGLFDRSAAHELPRPLRVALDHALRDADHARPGTPSSSSGLRRNMRAKPSSPSYQSWLPGIPSSTRGRSRRAKSRAPD